MGSTIFDSSRIIGLLLAVSAAVFYASHSVGAITGPMSPTIHAVEKFDPVADAEKLTALVIGVKNKTDDIYKLFVERSSVQRESIIYKINEMFGNTILFTVLIKFADGLLANAISNVLSRPVFLYTRELRNAIVDADEDTILEILLSADNNQIEGIVKDYKAQYDTVLIDDIENIVTSNRFKDIVNFLCFERKKSCETLSNEQIQSTARYLSTILEKTGMPDFTAIDSVLIDTCYPQFALVNKEYKGFVNHDILTAIGSKVVKSAVKNYDTITRYMTDRIKYFATKLHNAIHAPEPVLSDINRIIISRSEIDLGLIKTVYKLEYGNNLADEIQNVTVGDHQKLLLAFIGKH